MAISNRIDILYVEIMGNDEKSVNGIIINSGIVGSANEKWDQDLQ